MSIKIDKNKCVGCSRCVEVCPGNLIKIDGEKKAFIKYERDCWGCTSCVKECPRGAVFWALISEGVVRCCRLRQKALCDFGESEKSMAVFRKSS